MVLLPYCRQAKSSVSELKIDDWTSQISYEAVASVVRELNVFEALMCFS